MIYILDAYNVIHKISRLEAALERDLRAGRQALITFCSEAIQRRGDISRIILVFDGRTEFHGFEDVLPRGIETVFSDTGEDADERIITVLEGMEKIQGKCVVSDDNFVQNTARAHKTRGMSVAEFEKFCGPVKSTQKTAPGKPALSAREADEITENYRKELGLQ